MQALGDAQLFSTLLLSIARSLPLPGVDQVASDARSRMQTAQLHSDMSAFKAANPRAVFADFLRWCSPSTSCSLQLLSVLNALPLPQVLAP
jgi:hypothetical protein